MSQQKREKKTEDYPSRKGYFNVVGMYPTDLLGVNSTDPLGSYTGRPMDRDDKPVQDADDL